MQQKVLQSRLLSLSREITDCRAKTREDLQSLYSKIVGYVMQRSNLGSATDINAVRETTGTTPQIPPASASLHKPTRVYHVIACVFQQWRD